MKNELKSLIAEINGDTLGIPVLSLPGAGHYVIAYCPDHDETWSVSAASRIWLNDGRTMNGILTDDSLNGITDDPMVATFFLAHEVGHYEMGHMNVPEEEMNRLNELRAKGDVSSFERELAADRWAATMDPSILDAGIRAMSALLDNCAKNVALGYLTEEQRWTLSLELVERKTQLIRMKAKLDEKEAA